MPRPCASGARTGTPGTSGTPGTLGTPFPRNPRIVFHPRGWRTVSSCCSMYPTPDEPVDLRVCTPTTGAGRPCWTATARRTARFSMPSPARACSAVRAVPAGARGATGCGFSPPPAAAEQRRVSRVPALPSHGEPPSRAASPTPSAAPRRIWPRTPTKWCRSRASRGCRQAQPVAPAAPVQARARRVAARVSGGLPRRSLPARAARRAAT